jgi:hypothetical protein
MLGRSRAVATGAAESSKAERIAGVAGGSLPMTKPLLSERATVIWWLAFR